MKTLLLLVLLLLSPMATFAQNAAPDLWADWKFLLGEWTAGESSGVPGQADKGSFFTLTPELQGKALVRKNHAEYPAANGRPAIVHDDLMIVYRVPSAIGKVAIKAFYSDSEDHAIDYNVSLTPDKKRIVFLSEEHAGAPHYRLTYEDVQPGTVKVLFEIAPPDKPGQFTKYVEATVHRRT
jgi:hypothetical protein